MGKEYLPYIVWKRSPFKEGLSEPYIFARTSNKRTAIWLVKFALEENPNCRMHIDNDKDMYVISNLA